MDLFDLFDLFAGTCYSEYIVFSIRKTLYV
ncbi:hypothetical protein Ga0466249_001377 [Sporomusaceae bacterium BoRhaA]|nr:hypothetical protein [Pelorhabdus rhamnosifermentans]